MKKIREVVESYDVKLWAEGNILRGFCPLHDNKNTASFTVYEETDSWFCYGESIGGDAASFVARIEGIPYQDAKQRVSGVTNFQEEMIQTLDGLHVKDEVDYNNELNISISRYCRDLMYKKPQLTNDVLSFLKKLDTLLQKPITSDIMNSVIQDSRRLDK